MRTGDVDQFLDTQKTLSGVPRWQAGSRGNQFRIVWPLLIRGIAPIDGPRLEVVYAANAPHLRLSVSLNLPPVIIRADIDPTGVHTNKKPLKPNIPREIRGNNCHLWSDNRPAKAGSAVPVSLGVARPLPAEYANWPAALHWVCAQGHIMLHDAAVPPLPPRSTLL